MHLIIRSESAIEQTFRVIKHKYSDYRMKEAEKKAEEISPIAVHKALVIKTECHLGCDVVFT